MARSRRSAPAPARKAPAPAKAPAKAPAPAPVQAAPAPAPVQSAPAPSMGGGLMATVAEGMAFGTGSAIARHAVNAVVDSFSGSDDKAAPVAAAPVAAAPVAAAPSAAACLTDKKAFMDCLDRSANDISACQFYLDALNTCKQQSAFL